MSRYIIIGVLLVAMLASCSILSSKNNGPNPWPQPPAGYSETLPGSLHGTSAGMQWWYEQADGAGALFGVTYAETGCGNCHTDSCDDCHGDAAGATAVDQPTKCIVCHGRLEKEAALGVEDVHFDSGMVCSDCHSLDEIHGDGNTYNSMFNAAALSPECIDCHNANGPGAPVPTTTSHTLHGAALACDACHVSTVITCYNCHFQTLLDSHEKKAAAAFKNFIILMNDANGVVRAGTYQSAIYDGHTFVAFAPYHGHAISAEGRACADCHNGPRMTEYGTTGQIQMTWWDAGEGKVMHTDGVIPFEPDDMVFQFVDFVNGAWEPFDLATSQVGHTYQYKFCSPLTEDQLGALGATAEPTGPAATLPGSLHGTARGMQWWYEQADGAGPMFGVAYADTGCGNCHTDTCDDCHANADGTGGVDEPAVCQTCHSRVVKEGALELTDVHFDSGMTCSDCHTSEEIHGDGTTYNSMLDGGLQIECQDCHDSVDTSIPEHATHSATFNCDTCHVQSVITCYNCHFQSLLDNHEKKPAAAFKNFALLMNGPDGKLRLGSYQSVYYDGNGFVAFGPYHGHNITAAGRHCADCHANDRIQEYMDTGEIIMTTWNAGESKVEHTTGLVPFVPDDFVYQFLDFDGTAWSPVTPTDTQYQWKFCTPLDEDQLAKMAIDMPTAENLASSLHGTAAGMEWWYTQANGAGDFLGLAYADTGCGNCHTNGCDDCHANADGTGGVDQPAVCITCHGRQDKENALGVTDVHFDAGMLCADCHSMRELHGDGMSYDSMLQAGAMDTECENCHSGDGPGPDVPTSISHTLHGGAVACDACHMSSAVTCYNCHLQTLLDSHEKKAAAAFKDFILLINDEDGVVRAGTYQSVFYDNKGFIAFGPFHGHSVMATGRACADCHDNDRITELNDTDQIVMTSWNAGESKVEHTTGAIPFVPDKFVFQFVDWDGTVWSPVAPAETQFQWEWSSPLDATQLANLGVE